MGREFRARDLSESEAARIEQAKVDVRRAHGHDPEDESYPTDKELLLLLVNDTAPSWRKHR